VRSATRVLQGGYHVNLTRVSKENETLVINLLLVDRWTSGLLVPDQLVLLVEMCPLIRHWDDLATVPALLLADPHLVARDPEDRCLRGSCRMVVGIALRNGIVHDVSESSRHEAAESVVVRVFVGEQPFDDEVWLL